MKTIYQAQKKGCGYAVMKMALCHASGRSDFAYLQEPLIEAEAPSLRDLAIYARRYGLMMVPFKASPKESILENDEFPLAVILNEGMTTHMVYLYKKKRRHFYILDPARGKRVLKEKEFLNLFEGTVMIEEGYIDNSPRVSKPSVYPKSLQLLNCVVTLLPFCFLMAALGVLRLPQGLLLAGILFASSIALLLVERLFKIASMKRFDNLHLDGVLAMKSNERKERYAHYCRYKGLCLTTLPAFLLTLAEVIAASTLFALNDKYLGLEIAMLILLYLLYYLLYRNKEILTMQEVEGKERVFFDSPLDEDHRKAALHDLSRLGTAFSKELLLKEASGYALSIGLSAAMILICPQPSLETFLFYALSSSLVLNSLNSAFSLYEGLKEKEKEEPYFILHFPIREEME